MGDGSHFRGPVNGILCIFCAYLGRLARAVPGNLRILKKLKRPIMYVVFSTLILHERERYNNLMRVADHIMFEDEDVDNYIASRGEPDAKRPHNGNSGK